MSTTQERLIKVICKQLGVSESDVKPTSNLSDDLGADSLDAIELIMCIEDEFELPIPDETADGFKTVEDVVAYLISVRPELATA